MSDDFDFSAFLEKMASPDPETRQRLLDESVRDSMEEVMGELAPRLWCIVLEQMQKDPEDNVRLNAVLNGSLFAILGWFASCMPPDPSKDDRLAEMVGENMRRALVASRNEEHRKALAYVAHNVGKLKLMEDSCSGMAKVLTANSMIVRGVHDYIQRNPKG